MRSFLRNSLFLFIFLVTTTVTRSYAQIDTVCASASMGGSSDSSDIGRFIIGTDTFGTLYSHLANPAAIDSYKYYSTDTILLFIDSTYNIQEAGIMNTIHDASAKLTLFIDYNNSNVFDLPQEMVWTANSTAFYNYILNGNITIPATATTGVPLRMRLILNNDTTANAASDGGCGTYFSGETVDFVVVITTPPSLSVKPAMAMISELKLSPNPGSGKFVLSMKTATVLKQLQVSIMSVTGQTVFGSSYSDINGQFSTTIDLSAMPKGLYFIETNADGDRQLNKIVIE